MKGQLVDFHGSVLLSILGIGLMLLLYMYVHNFFLLRKTVKNSRKESTVLKSI